MIQPDLAVTEEKIIWIEIIQYVRPNGIQRKLTAPVREKFATMSSGMNLTCEMIMPNQIMMWAVYCDEDGERELSEMKQNSMEPIIFDPILEKLIERVYNRRIEENGKEKTT